MLASGLSDFRRLRLFLEIASLGSFSAAADVLGLSQSGASQQISSLERELGVALFDRTHRPVRLTRAGETLRRHAVGLVAQAARASAALAEDSPAISAVTVSAFHSATATLIPDALERLGAERPGVLVRPLDLHTEAIWASLWSHEADLSIVFHDLESDPSVFLGLEHELILRDPFVMVLPRDRVAIEPMPLALLADERWIVPSRTGSGGICRRFVDRAFSRAGFNPRVVAESDNYGATQHMVAKGIGVALVPALSVMPELEIGAVAIDVGGVRGVSVAWLENRSLSMDARGLRRALRIAGAARAQDRAGISAAASSESSSGSRQATGH